MQRSLPFFFALTCTLLAPASIQAQDPFKPNYKAKYVMETTHQGKMTIKMEVDVDVLKADVKGSQVRLRTSKMEGGLKADPKAPNESVFSFDGKAIANAKAEVRTNTQPESMIEILSVILKPDLEQKPGAKPEPLTWKNGSVYLKGQASTLKMDGKVVYRTLKGTFVGAAFSGTNFELHCVYDRATGQLLSASGETHFGEKITIKLK